MTTPAQSAARAPLGGVATALLAAALFGASTPLTKLLGAVDPLILAGLLYLGSGVGLTCVRLLRRHKAPPIPRGDWPWLAGAIFFGGVLGPICLVLGLRITSGATAALLLNLEGVLTAALAWLVFREAADRRIVLGMLFIVAGGAALTWQSEGGLALSPGALLVAAACLGWAIDNNLLQRVSAGDALQIASLKGLVAGSVNLTLGLLLGQHIPDLSAIGMAALVGLIGYGVSLVLYVIALRALGTARTGAYYAAAPFIGAGLSVVLLGESLSPQLLVAGVLMGIGLWLHLTEQHGHDHDHHEMAHTHPHVHDAHHQHDHDSGADERDGHSHAHEHLPLLHRHPHYPDLHHRHEHAEGEPGMTGDRVSSE
jgi:drug/metabolite transporter (DMT)-like permease